MKEPENLVLVGLGQDLVPHEFPPAGGLAALRRALDPLITPFVLLMPASAQIDSRACSVLAEAIPRAAADMALAPVLLKSAEGIIGPSPVVEALCRPVRLSNIVSEPDLLALAGSGGVVLGVASLRRALIGHEGSLDGPAWADLCGHTMAQSAKILVTGMPLWSWHSPEDAALDHAVLRDGSAAQAARRASHSLAVSQPPKLERDRLYAALRLSVAPDDASPMDLKHLLPLSDFALDWFPGHRYIVLHLLINGDMERARHAAANPSQAFAVLEEVAPDLSALLISREVALQRYRGLAPKLAEMEDRMLEWQTTAQDRARRLHQAHASIEELTLTVEQIRSASIGS